METVKNTVKVATGKSSGSQFDSGKFPKHLLVRHNYNYN